MMKKEDDFFSGIEDTLHSYEDAYVPGAWEDFQEKRKRRAVAIWFFRLGSAAAVLLLLSYAAIQFYAKKPESAQFAHTKKIIQPKNNQEIPSSKENTTTDQFIAKQEKDTTAQQSNKQVLAKADKVNNLFKPGALYQRLSIDKSDTDKKNTTAVIAQNKPLYQPEQRIKSTDTASAKAIQVDASKGVIAQAPVKRYPGGTRSVYDSLVNSKNNRQTDVAIKKNEKSLTYSVVVSPAVGNQKFNFGTGLQVSYKIANNLFVNSGVAYSSLNANAAGTQGADPYKRTQNVNLEVSGFEVPVGLQYRTKKGFYVSAGVLAMNVMNNHLQYDYIVEGTTSTLLTSGVNNSTALTPPAVRAVPEQKTEESKEKINNVLGFYILSIGQKKTIGNKKFNFGPFLRVPFGPVSSENIRLLQGGVSLGFDF